MTYEVLYYNARWWVKADGRLIGGYSANDLRSYVFPLYTPQGILVLQECPPDHHHHQGIFAGLEIDGHDLWAAGSDGRARHRQEIMPALAEMTPLVDENGVTFAHTTRWATANGEDLLLERRQVRLSQNGGVTLVAWRSEFGHPTRTVELGQTKESGIGLRVPPHWETVFGGRIRNAVGGTGEAGCFDQRSPWLAIEGPAGGSSVAGMVIAPQTEPCPWFTRDYGLHVYNPARHRAITIHPGEAIVWEARIMAYDGSLFVREIDRLVTAQRAS